ncbi:MarR family winged helix-turn-helix transcriptional regulator [Motilibacter aurantiacus]|uniref:MarR family winged helix-turn-helix transcriptional regulator n=1 Tax=Motilibacter aurantiacus TaxID=2714955 RepID=UPI001407ACA3|nr:MarR family winged helix-turn-helix transcriptional regulator [Motilibacter aurantiacus]NHC47413.1 winged helix-turn-helix transcriptional regulator [Motilibacter aurantiacus]
MSQQAAQPGRPAPGPVDRALRDVLTLSALTRVAMADRLGLALRDVEAVEHVMTEPDGRPLGPAELARRLGVSSAAATQGLHRLESAGHVVRRPHPADGRRQVVEVTPQGSAHVLSELGPLLARLHAVGQALPPEEQDAVTRYLTQVGAVMRDYLEEEGSAAGGGARP